MDVVYPILIGIGLLIMVLALFIKGKPAADADSPIPTHRTTEKAEWEKSLQRLGRQLREEQEQVSLGLQQTGSELNQELAMLRNRVEQLEREWSNRQKQIVNVSSEKEVAATVEESTEVDMLALKERYRRVFELEKEGLSVDEIAKRLGAGRGEIELIFSLASKKERGHGDA